MTGEDIINRAIAVRQAQGLSVERIVEGQPHVRHCVDAADRDAYVARCAARGETTRIVTRATERLDAAIETERAAQRPCPDLLAYFEALRSEDEATIDAELDGMGIEE